MSKKRRLTQRRGVMPRPLNGQRTFRVGRLVVRLTPDAVLFRGFHKKKWRSLRIVRILSMLDGDEPAPLLAQIEESCGARVLSEIGATGV